LAPCRQTRSRGVVNLADLERLFPATLGSSGTAQQASKGVPRPELPRHRHDGWRKLGEWIDDEPPQGEEIEERGKPQGRKTIYAKGSVEWEKQQEEEERLARIAAQEEKEKRRGARIAAVLGKRS
jgi:hypothetical protein